MHSSKSASNNRVDRPQDSGECFGGFGGVTWQWDSKPIPPARNCSGNFPGGWPQFAKDLGLPFMMHISEVRNANEVPNNADRLLSNV